MMETEVLRAGAAESENTVAARQPIQMACFIGIMGNGSSVECELSIASLNGVPEFRPHPILRRGLATKNASKRKKPKREGFGQ